LARERTALAWTRSALTMAASGVLIARAAFVGHLAVLGVVSAVAMASLTRPFELTANIEGSHIRREQAIGPAAAHDGAAGRRSVKRQP